MSAVVTPTSRNHLLGMLPFAELSALRPRLERVEVRPRLVVMQADTPIKVVIFPETCVVSMISILEDGAQIEVGVVGAEGFVGMPLLLGVNTSPMEAMVQVSGTLLRLPASGLRQALADAPSLQGLMLRYLDFFQAQTAQSVACNSRHQIEQRLARWLLITHDRVEGDWFEMTQQFLSTLLGVRRPGVTLAVGMLQKAGLIEHRRGQMRVLDRVGLEAAACECYAHVKRRLAWQQQPQPQITNAINS